jgi:hypothetical protein
VHQPLLPRLEVVQHTGPIHRIVMRLAMDLDDAEDVAHNLVDVPDCAHYHGIEHFVPGQCVLDCGFGHLLDFLLNPLCKGADVEGLAEGRFAHGRSRVAFWAEGALCKRLRTAFWLGSRSIVRGCPLLL